MRSTPGSREAGERADVPPGFSRNPTRPARRVALAGLALAGLAVAGYLTLYQVGVDASAWDPIFGAGSTRVLDLTAPVPDAAAGVLAYAAELVLLAVGGPARWRTQPWTCLALGAVLSTGAAVSLILIVIQPVVVDHWCTLCLCSAAVSLSLFALGIDEARAAGGAVRRARRCGVPPIAALRGRAAGDPS